MTSKKLPIILLAVLVLTLVVFYFTNTPSSPAQSEQTDTIPTPTNANIPEPHNTIASEWQWSNVTSESVKVVDGINGTAPFTAKSVYDALQAVKLNEDGEVILDHDALISLDEALERIHNLLNAETLQLLQNIIKDSLPGIAGEQVAKLVGDYYNFLEAEEEFSRLDNEMTDENRAEDVAAVESDQALYAELQALREVHLGTDATAELFRVSDANAQFMFDSMKVERDTNLTQEQKAQRFREIEEQHTEQSINILNWPSRYRAFLDSKNSILASNLDDSDKQTQVLQLLSQHFTAQELAKVSYLGLERI